MDHILSPQGRGALRRAMADRCLLAFDFDGTLAPIVTRPSEARPSRAVVDRLVRLARHHPVAVISGRSLEDLRGRIGFVPTYLSGNHGAQLPGVWDYGVAAAALDPFRVRLDQVTSTLVRLGVQVEDKGLSVALHFRQSRDRRAAEALIARLLRDLPAGLRAFGGKCVLNVVPERVPDKAGATRALMRAADARCVVYAGDDLNDEPVFSTADTDWVTIRVGIPSTGSSAARYFIHGTIETATVLEVMVGLCPPAGPPG
jgi:trehalose 6-phosphate phosphatase